MPISARFSTAVRLLDLGRSTRAEALLADCIAEAESAADDLGLVQALVCLGDVLQLTGRPDEAVPLLRRALSLRRDDDALAVEFDRASHLLAEIDRT